MKKVVVISDTHCGHVLGLTHPDWYMSKNTEIGKTQRRIYKTWKKIITPHLNPDILLFIGDAIEGKGSRSGGTELITADRNEQCSMAANIINDIGAKKIRMVNGTGYHVGDEEDFEVQVAEKTGAKIEGRMWLDIDDVVFDCRHKIGGSSVPHGRNTPLAKEWVWNQLWAAREEQPRANVFLRGHVHYYSYCGGQDWLAMSLPALQWYGSKYGTRQCSGLVDFGIVVFYVEDGGYTWEPVIKTISKEIKPAEKL